MEFMTIGNVVIRKDAILTLQIFGRQNDSFIEIGLINGRYIKTEFNNEDRINQQLDVILDDLESGE